MKISTEEKINSMGSGGRMSVLMCSLWRGCADMVPIELATNFSLSMTSSMRIWKSTSLIRSPIPTPTYKITSIPSNAIHSSLFHPSVNLSVGCRCLWSWFQGSNPTLKLISSLQQGYILVRPTLPTCYKDW